MHYEEEKLIKINTKLGFHLGAIQIIRDTLGGGGGKTKCHMSFFALLNSDFKASDSKKLSLKE